ncbi:hypothetical protein ABZV58_09260 [Nocardia sp. NPDC004654]|uniref:hypothetical protein n=1 Tax=Nocardia sp. NPDC004654 TaxID=3154776 RepID=UPI0033B71E9F
MWFRGAAFRGVWFRGAAFRGVWCQGAAFRGVWFRAAASRSAWPRGEEYRAVASRAASRRFAPWARGARHARAVRCVRRQRRMPRRRTGLPATKHSVRCGRPKPPASSGAPRRRCRRPPGRRRCRACRSPRAGAPRCPTRPRRPTRRPAGRAPCVPSSPSMPELRAWPGDSIRSPSGVRGEHRPSRSRQRAGDPARPAASPNWRQVSIDQTFCGVSRACRCEIPCDAAHNAW